MNMGAQAGAGFEGEVKAAGGAIFALHPSTQYRVVCRGPVKGADGRWRRKLKWVELVRNLVTTEGKNDQLSKYFKGASYTAAFYVGLVNNAAFSAFAVGDTAAQIGGSNGWAESTTYSESVRQTLTLGSVSAASVDNSASKATFSINGTVTIHGAFLATVSTKSGTTGVLYGEAAFSADRSLTSGDSLTVTATLTLS